MPSTKKPRSDSKVAGLAPEIRAEVARRIVEDNQKYADIAAWLKAEHGVSVSPTALSNWYSIYSWKTNSASAREFSQDIKAEAAAQGDYDAATLALIQERAYIMAKTHGADVNALATLAGIITDSAKLRLKEREVALTESALNLKLRQYEDKISAARASLEKAKSKGGLNKTTLELIEEQLRLL